MTEMEERVARALCAQSLVGISSIETAVDKGWPRWVPSARVMIRAMRVPSEAMLNAARDWSRETYGRPIGRDAAAGCWQAMSDAALGEP
jgi:hypothetical protein